MDFHHNVQTMEAIVRDVPGVVKVENRVTANLPEPDANPPIGQGDQFRRF
jgi:hypothetical protein